MGQTEDAILAQMEEDGTADWIRAQTAAALGHAPEATAETPDEDTVDADEEVVDEEEVPETPDADATPPDSELADEPEGDFLDLEPDDIEYLSKYGFDPEADEIDFAVISKAIKGAREAQGLIGRQGNELGDLRTEVQRLRETFEAQQSQPQVSYYWPDEDAEPEDQVQAYRAIANQAFQAGDVESLQYAMGAWNEIDPMGTQAQATLFAAQIAVQEARSQSATPSEPPVTLDAAMATLTEKYPELKSDDFQKEVGAELDRFPTLLRTFQDQTADPAERVRALEEATVLVKSRKVSGDAEQARKRVAVKNAEEARRARAEARVAQSGGRGRTVEPEDREIALGKTGLKTSENSLKEAVKQLTGMDITVG